MPMSDKVLDELITSARPEPRRPMQVDAETVVAGVAEHPRTRFRWFGALGQVGLLGRHGSLGRLSDRRTDRKRSATLGTSAAAIAAVVLAAGAVYGIAGQRYTPGIRVGITSGGPSAVRTYSPVPLAQNYAAFFSIDHGSPLLSAPTPLVRTQFKVNVSDWNSNYDGGSYAVYMLVTNTTSPVIDVETSNSQNFAYAGWFDPVSMNRRLHSLGLLAPSKVNYGGTLITVLNATSATSVFDVRTKKHVRPEDWRLVVMAIGGNHGKIHVLWTKEIAPS